MIHNQAARNPNSASDTSKGGRSIKRGSVIAGERALVVRHRGAVVRRLPLRGVREGQLPFERYVEVPGQEARAQARRAQSPAASREA